MNRYLALPIAIAAFCAPQAQASVVLGKPVTTTVNPTATATVVLSSVLNADTIGQTFVPTQSYLTSMAFRFGSTTRTTTGTVTLALYAGAIAQNAALPASALFSQQYALTGLPFRGVGDFTTLFTGQLAVTANTAYTVVLSGTSNVALAFDHSEGYKPGYLLQTKLNDPTCRSTPGACDASFRFTTATPVPEPASWAVMLGGFVLAGGAIRYRRRRTTVAFG
ncbi:PEPxxWA-CTERM sorting domain-containing protein [Sphingomonas azotifigens]|uniref:PEPxxWA-CTERM sorting domain-containing protein n=1 Tax=Sphingomonas azotifigens TaxID=330920 RepID=UPI0009FBEF99|nr:PEPxxWA-CTERM sorting domain-containing protein [Sphingomonas azotifigens]